MVLLALGVTNCSKEQVNTESILFTTRSLTQEQSAFIESAKRTVAEYAVSNRDVTDPTNLSNALEYVGHYVQNFFITMNQSEIANPSASFAAYKQKAETLLASQPSSFSLSSTLDISSPFFQEIRDLIMVSSGNSGAVVELKAWENVLANTTILTELERTALIGLATMMKYTVSHIAEEGIVIGSIVYNDDNMPQGYWDCFSSVWEDAIGDNMGVLTNYQQPATKLTSCISLPGTLIVSIIDGAFTAAQDPGC